jgi:hypothetical protein
LSVSVFSDLNVFSWPHAFGFGVFVFARKVVVSHNAIVTGRCNIQEYDLRCPAKFKNTI